MMRTWPASPNGLPEDVPLTDSARDHRTEPVTCIVLVGLPGAGKSTVGPLVAERLGWVFTDLDAEIERVAGRSVTAIFAADGEESFRRLEHEATGKIAGTVRGLQATGRSTKAGSVAGVVVAPGGGWMLDPANVHALGPGARTVYLRVSPEVAEQRMAASAASRPLLATSDPLTALRGLLAARETVYLQANHTVAAEMMTPAALADSIVALVSRGQRH